MITSEKHQALMDKAYESWTDEMSMQQFWDSLSPNMREAVLIGNLNYQVENGGFMQWFGNGYGTVENGLEIVMVMCRLETPACLKVAELVEHAMVIQWAHETDEPEEEWYEKDFNHLDIDFYKVNEQMMADYEASL